ncbi:RNA 2',3'-cyclic phosphodiesterase, partial [Thermosulfurimonas sp.]|uniref:RNA 2',3'-cyclic phosphodiesterase n=1 Tax=Thermosulfurimonas sp. TaxID=2080236 RepID=UPI0025D4CF77
MRCFLAVALPEEIKEILRGLQEELRAAGAGVRWVRPEGFHLTLKFFGEIPEEKLPSLVQAAEQTARDFEPFELTLSEIGFFPEKGT